MAVTIASGNLSDGSIWDTGVTPVSPEFASIGHTVIQDAPWDIGGGANDPSIFIQPGAELITNDAVNYNGEIVNIGSLTHHSGTVLSSTGGSWVINQVAIPGTKWSNVPGATAPVFTAEPGYYWTWRDSALGDPSVIDLDGVEFYRCGDSANAGILLRGHNAPGLNVQIRNVLWHTCGQLREGVGVTHHPDAICQIENIVIVNPLASPILEYSSNFAANWVAGNRYFKNIYINGLLPNGNPAEVRILRKNDMANPLFDVTFATAIDAAFNNFGGGNVSLAGTFKFDQYTGGGSEINLTANAGSGLLIDLLISADRFNAHVVATPQINPLSSPMVLRDSLVEFQALGGANFMPYKDGGLDMQGCLVINGNPVYSTTSNVTGTLTYEHCTHVILSDAPGGEASMIQETNAVDPAYIGRGRSSMRIDYRATPSVDFAVVLPPTNVPIFDDQYDELDHNNHWVPAVAMPFNPYPTITITGLTHGDAGFGGNDLFVDPQFAHPPRSLRDFDSLHGGPGTAINLWREFFKQSGYDYLGNPAAANPAVTPMAAKAWVEEAYAPTNPALQGVAHDGGDVGAFAVASSGVDVTAPVIALVGEAVQSVQLNGDYSDTGATALDDTDGDITSSIVTTGLPVDVSTVGSYIITYNVSDAAGNAADEVVRIVNIFDPNASVKPATTLVHTLTTKFISTLL